jgi:hypothetical protein
MPSAKGFSMKIALSPVFAVCGALSLVPSVAWADPAATPAEPAPMAQPPITGPLLANPHPFSIDAGPLGTINVNGVLSGVGFWQNSVYSGDHRTDLDLSNGQVIVQKADGMAQFFVQAGGYSMPALGAPYLRTGKTVDNFYGLVPVAYAKFAPTESFSIQAGKLPTLIGAEYTFTFQNMNIQRGLLWNQETAISRGAQVNYTAGPLALSLSLTDGFYSNRYNWVTGLATYTFNPEHSLSFVGGANAGHTNTSKMATPVLQNNSQIYNLIYTYNSGPWLVQPYFQATSVPKDLDIGAAKGAQTYGGALLAKYSFGADSRLPGVSLPVRVEYIASTGDATNGAPSLLYGAGSKAWSITVTPTYQRDVFFARAEASYTGVISSTPGFAMGASGDDTSQVRVMLEAGIIF